MTWTILLTGPARRDLGRLDRQVAERVVRALAGLAEADSGDVRLLSGRNEEWRLRVGDWRVRFRYDRPNQTIVVQRILPRGRAYRR